jgi:peroxiredoxin
MMKGRRKQTPLHFTEHMPNPKVGDAAPDFTALDDADRRISLSDFRGKMVVLYFYPKDDTPG